MITKKNITITAVAVLIVALVLWVSLQKDDLDKTQIAVSSCLQLQAGNVSLELEVPPTFLDTSHVDAIRINQKSGTDKVQSGGGILGIDVRSYDPLENILKHLVPGPKYLKSNLNGYDAGFSHTSSGVNTTDSDAQGEHFGSIDQYVIPFGNRNFYIFFQPDTLSLEEAVLATTMLHSVKLSQTKDDVKDAQVKECGK